MKSFPVPEVFNWPALKPIKLFIAPEVLAEPDRFPKKLLLVPEVLDAPARTPTKKLSSPNAASAPLLNENILLVEVFPIQKVSPAVAVDQYKAPEPFVVKNWPEEPSDCGKEYVPLALLTWIAPNELVPLALKEVPVITPAKSPPAVVTSPLFATLKVPVPLFEKLMRGPVPICVPHNKEFVAAL